MLDEIPEGNIEVWSGLDMADMAAIKAFGEKAKEILPFLDIVILNAGLYSLEFQTSKHGYEIQLQVNTLGTALLSLYLLPVLERTVLHGGDPARLLFIGTEVHALSNFKQSTCPSVFETQTLLQRNDYIPGQGYQLSKLLQILFERELASRVDPSKVLVCTCTPGYCSSNLFKEWHGALAWVTERCARTCEVGARCYINAALHTTNEEFHGNYFSASTPTAPSAYVLSSEGKLMQREIWTQVMDIFEKLNRAKNTA